MHELGFYPTASLLKSSTSIDDGTLYFPLDMSSRMMAHLYMNYFRWFEDGVMTRVCPSNGGTLDLV